VNLSPCVKLQHAAFRLTTTYQCNTPDQVLQMIVSYLLGDYGNAEKFADGASQTYLNSAGAMSGAYSLFYESMALLAQARRGKRRYRILPYVRRPLRRLKVWAFHAPTNFLGKENILEAELAWTWGGENMTANLRFFT
jgi:hypothetical protein